MKLLKTKVSNVKSFLFENVWLSLILVVILIVLGIAVWDISLKAAEKSRLYDSVKVMVGGTSQMQEDGKAADTSASPQQLFENLSLKIKNGYAFLCDEDRNIVFGPCRYIYDDFKASGCSKIFRYVDMNGFIGYAKIGEESITTLLPGMFTEASRMQEECACVKEKEEYYFINLEGKRFTSDTYIEAFPFAESQGRFARVRKEDGTWSIIDRDGEEVLSGFEYINSLPYMNLRGSGKREGKAVIISLKDFEGEKPSVFNEYTEFSEIRVDYSDCNYAIVTKKDGKEGVVCLWNGEVLIPAEYENIQCEYDKMAEDVLILRCTRSDGTFDFAYVDA